MRRATLTFSSLLVILVLAAACGGGDAPAEPRRSEPMPVEDTVFGDMIETQDRARAVEDVGMERKQEMDRVIEETGGQ